MAGKKGVMDPGRCWVWMLATLQAISVFGTELSSEACRELGFSSNLLCSSCELLSQFGLSELDPFCRKCCQEEALPETKKCMEFVVLSSLKGKWQNLHVLRELRGLKNIQDAGHRAMDSLETLSLEIPAALLAVALCMVLVSLTVETCESPGKKSFPQGKLGPRWRRKNIVSENFEDCSIQGLFLKSVDENWAGSLRFRYVRGSDPVLKLLDDEGNIAEELSILKWNTDSVEEFLSEKLERL